MALITTPTPNYYFKICTTKISYQGPNENVQSGNKTVQSGSERAQSHGRVQFGSGQAQSSSTSMAVQIKKNKPREEIKPVHKETQKVELEKSLESESLIK